MTARVPAGTFEAPSVLSLYVEPISFGGGRLGGATGFLWRVGTQDFLVTNWHVLSGRNSETGEMNPTGAAPAEIEIAFLGERHGDRIPMRFAICSDPESGRGALWLEHPRLGHRMDVGVLPVDLGHTPPFNARPLVTGTVIYNIDELYPGTDLFAVGYPFEMRPGGFTAVWVRGTVASEPNIDYDDRPCFLLDARTREGQSGAPVIEFEPHGVVTSGTGIHFQDGPLVRVHGVYSGRTDKQSDIGFVWKRSAVVDILTGGTPPADDILFGTRWPDEIRAAAPDREVATVMTDYWALDPADWSCDALEDLVRRCERLQELGPIDDEGLVLQGSPIVQPAMTAHSRAVEHDGEHQRLQRRFDRGANARFHALFREQIAAHAAAVGDIPVAPAKVVEIVARLEQVLRSFAATAKPPA